MKKILLLLIMMALVQPVVAIGIGISPSEIRFNNSLKGSEYQSSFTIFNTGPEQINFSLGSSGGIGDWVSFYNLNNYDTKINSVNIPGKDRVSVLVKIKVPVDAQNGIHNGSLDVKSIPDVGGKNSSSGQSLVIGASAEVTIDVTGEQVIEGNVYGIMTKNIEPGYPLEITTMFQNTGNVVATPKIAITILYEKNIINSFIYENTSVKPSITEPIITEWMTTAANIPANYTANVEVSLNGQILKSDNLSFQIVPVGTFTKSGNLTQIILDDKPDIDTVVRVRAYFINTGQIETQAKFSAEVFKDNKLIDTISSDDITAPINKEIALISYLKLTSPGDYLIKGKVIFGGKETPVKEYSFKVNAKKSTPGFGVIIAVFAILGTILYRKKNKK